MVITQNDVNNDLNMLTSELAGQNRQLVSPVAALKLSMAWPMVCVSAYAISLAVSVMLFKTPDDPFFSGLNPYFHYMGADLAAGAISLFFALAIGFGLYGPAMAYLSIPKEVRQKSLIISRLKKTAAKMAVITAGCNFVLAIISLFYSAAICAAPIMLLVTFLVMQGVMSAEITRYGMSTVIGKVSKLLKKI